MFWEEIELTKEQDEQIRRYKQNSIYILKNEDTLRKNYPDVYVAVYDSKVVDSDKNLKSLLSRLEGKYGEEEAKKIAFQYISKQRINPLLTKAAA